MNKQNMNPPMCIISHLLPVSKTPSGNGNYFVLVESPTTGRKLLYLGILLDGNWVDIFGCSRKSMKNWIPYITHFLSITWPEELFNSCTVKLIENIEK